MIMTNEAVPVVDEAIWQQWIEKSKLREARRAHRMRTAGLLGLALVAIAVALYRLLRSA